MYKERFIALSAFDFVISNTVTAMHKCRALLPGSAAILINSCCLSHKTLMVQSQSQVLAVVSWHLWLSVLKNKALYLSCREWFAVISSGFIPIFMCMLIHEIANLIHILLFTWRKGIINLYKFFKSFLGRQCLRKYTTTMGTKDVFWA